MDPPRGADSDSDGDLAPSFLARRRRRNASDGEHGTDGRINRHRRHHLHDDDDYEEEDDLDDQDYDGEDGEGDAGVEEEDRLGLAESRLESAEKRLGSAADKRLGPAKNKLGFPKDRLGLAENRLESAENRLESPESRFGKAVGGGKPIGLGFAHNRQRSRRKEEEEEDDEEEEEDEEDEEDYEEETDEEEGEGDEDDDEERFNQGKKEESIGGSSSRAKESVASEEKKDSAEPFVVPTAGAFYMHDDRFRRGTGGARRRYSGGGRRQWGGKDEKPWVHDRFEELTLNEEKLSREGARGKGWYKRRGRGRTLGYSQGRNGRVNGSEDRNISSSYYDNKRERGTRRPDSHGTQDSSPTGNKLSGKQQWETMNNSNSPPVSKKRDSLSARYSASALNSASPAFYPTNSLQQSQTGQGSFQQSQLGQSSGVTKTGSGHNDQSNKKNRDGVQQVGRSVVPSRKAGNLSPSPSSVQITIPSVNSGNNSASNQKGGGNVQTNSGKKQVSKIGAGTPYKKPEVDLQEDGEQLSIAEAVKQMTRLARVHQSVELARAQQSQSSKQGHDSQPHVSSSLTLNQAAPSKLPTSEIANATSSQENKAKNPVSGISSRSSSALQIGRGSLMYGGGHIGGFINSGGGHSGGLVNSGGGHGGGLVSSGLSSGLRSAVPYGAQPQMGLGMPPVGMALPGYSGQPPFGFGNSEVTWVPILAGTSSTGTGYTPPYVTMDGSTTPFFYTQPAAQSASFNVPGRDLNAGKPSTGLSKVCPRTDIASDKFVQEQSKS